MKHKEKLRLRKRSSLKEQGGGGNQDSRALPNDGETVCVIATGKQETVDGWGGVIITYYLSSGYREYY